MIIKLEELNKEELIEIIYKKDKTIKDKDEIIQKLERELKKYKNPNTPSSAHKHIKPDTQGLKAKKGARRGAPKGHKGATLVLGEPQQLISVYAKECEHCHSKKIELTRYIKKRKIIRLIIDTNIVEYDQHEVRCLDCHELTLPKHLDLPDQGIYDKKILAIVNYLKFKARVPHKTLEHIIKNILTIPMTGPTTFNIIKRTSRKCRPAYEEIEEQIRRSPVVHADETSHSVQGVNNWIWVFCNSMLTLFKFHPARGGTIVENTLGKDFKGKLVSDGWHTYTAYCRDNKIRQGRCWSHGLREVKDNCKDKHPDLYTWYCGLYDLVKKAKTYKRIKERERKYEYCKSQLKLLIGAMKSRTYLRELATLLENGGEAWFTTILYPEVPMDNNEAERSLRPFVVIRKIIGCFRSEIGPKIYETMMSLVSTWEKQGKNPITLLETLV